MLGNLERTWEYLLSQPNSQMWVGSLAGVVGLSLLVLAFVTWRAARVLNATWQVSASGGRWTRWRERFCTPVVFRNLYRRWLQWSLNSNPVGWLERRTWSSRMVKWAWLAILSALYGFVLTDDSLLRHEFTEIQTFLAAGLIVSAAASFRRERDNGVLTLLLISPLRIRQVVWGRLRALWSQYLPAIGLLFGAWLYLHRTLGRENNLFWIVFFAVSFLCVPMIGLYCSLWRQTFFGALLWTVLYALVFPLVIAVLLLYSVFLDFPPAASRPAGLLYVSFGQITIALITLLLLLRKLTQRSFKLLPAV